MKETISVFSGRQSHYLADHFFNVSKQSSSDPQCDKFCIFEEIEENKFRPRGICIDYSWTFQATDVTGENLPPEVSSPPELKGTDNEELFGKEAIAEESLSSYESQKFNLPFSLKNNPREIYFNARHVGMFGSRPQTRINYWNQKSHYLAAIENRDSSSSKKSKGELIDEIRKELETSDSVGLFQIACDWKSGFALEAIDTLIYLREEHPKTPLIVYGTEEFDSTADPKLSISESLSQACFVHEIGTFLGGTNSVVFLRDPSKTQAISDHHEQAYIDALALASLSIPFRLNELYQNQLPRTADPHCLFKLTTSTRHPFNGLLMSCPFPGDVTSLRSINDVVNKTRNEWTVEKTPLFASLTGKHPKSGEGRINSELQYLSAQGLPFGSIPMVQKFTGDSCENLYFSEDKQLPTPFSPTPSPFGLSVISHGGDTGEIPGSVDQILNSLGEPRLVARAQRESNPGMDLSLPEVIEGLYLMLKDRD